MKKKIVIAAGGTGGHLYPAMCLAKQLTQQNPSIEILFAGGGLEKNAFFEREHFAFRSIEVASLGKKSLLPFLKASKSIVKGVWQSRKILATYAPDLVIGFGSYHTFPLLYAAKMAKYPIVLHEQNSVPGRVIRYFAKKALFTGIYFPQAASGIRGTAVELAMPLREGYALNSSSKDVGCHYFGLDPTKKTILTFGGSQGAHFLNEQLPKALALLNCNTFQVLHFTGHAEQTSRLQNYYSQAAIPAVVKTFEPQMANAWHAADLLLSRAGAGTIAEQMEFEVPGILIPYPHATDNHQDSNADFLVSTVGGGWKYREKDLDSKTLAAILKPLLEADSGLLQAKRKSFQHYKSKASPPQFSSMIQQYL